jgi:hypothetical protein
MLLYFDRLFDGIINIMTPVSHLQDCPRRVPRDQGHPDAVLTALGTRKREKLAAHAARGAQRGARIRASRRCGNAEEIPRVLCLSAVIRGRA